MPMSGLSDVASAAAASSQVDAAVASPAQPAAATPTSASASDSSSSPSSSQPSSSISTLPAHNAIYKQQSYWDERFSKEEKYEWLSGYSSIRSLLRSLLRESDRILHVGCGNSELGRELYMDGFKRLTNIDYSATVIHAQRQRNKDCPDMDWQVMNMESLQFPTGSFDVVLDKCALDALVVDEGDPWGPRAEVREQVDRVLSEVSRVLKPEGGKFIQISFGQPIHRLKNYLEYEKYGWEVTVQNWSDSHVDESVEGSAADGSNTSSGASSSSSSFGFFLYTCTRTTDTARLTKIYEEKRRRHEEEEERLRLYEEQQRKAMESDDDDERQGQKLFAMDL